MATGLPTPIQDDGRGAPLLRLRGLHKSYPMGANALHALKGIELDVAAGELVAIMGASGSGKSTLLNVLGLLDHYDAGEYHLDGRLVRNLSESRAAGLRSQLLGFVFQSFNLIAFKTAVENVAMPLYYQGVPRRERNRRALDYLDQVGLADWAGHLPRELSGGQQQRVAIARALIGQPKVILADEPTGALDSQTSHEVMEVLQRINASGVTILIVTHEREVAAGTRRIIRLRDGVIEADERADTAMSWRAVTPPAQVPGHGIDAAVVVDIPPHPTGRAATVHPPPAWGPLSPEATE